MKTFRLLILFLRLLEPRESLPGMAGGVMFIEKLLTEFLTKDSANNLYRNCLTFAAYARITNRNFFRNHNPVSVDEHKLFSRQTPAQEGGQGFSFIISDKSRAQYCGIIIVFNSRGQGAWGRGGIEKNFAPRSLPYVPCF